MEYLTDEDYLIAERNGISHKTAYQRFYLTGWTKERAITQKIEPSRWSVYREICETNGISQQTFNDRIRRGKSPEEAATTPVGKRIANKS
jgi:hypothetical protein